MEDKTMSAEVSVISTSDVITLARFAPRVSDYVTASRATSTLRGYRSDWKDFEGWCRNAGVSSLPASPPTVASYLTTVADRGLKSGTIQRRIAAISAFHTSAGFDSPSLSTPVKLTMAGIRRTIGTHQEGKAPLLTTDIAAMLSKVPGDTKGIRDRAILLIGYAGALRRSEIIKLNFEDVEFTEEGLKVIIRRSKTDQEAQGQVIGIATGGALCPVRALNTWLTAGKITEGPLFRAVKRYGFVRGPGDTLDGRLTDQRIADVVKKYARAAGLDPAKYAGHSLRAGLVTQAAVNGVPELAIMKQTRHKSSDMLRKYIRDASLFRENASARVGL